MDNAFTVEAPSLVGIGAESIVDRAKSLGLTWTLRPATVAVVVDDSPTGTQIIYDGDTEPINCMNLGVNVVAGDRVMGLMVPPSGNYIIGPITGPSWPGFVAEASSTSSTGAIGTTPVATLTIPGIVWRAGRAYEVRYGGLLSAVLANTTVVGLRPSSILGAEFVTWFCFLATGEFDTRQGIAKVRNATGSDITYTNLVLSMRTSTSTITVVANAMTVRYLEVWDVGAAADFPNASQV